MRDGHLGDHGARQYEYRPCEERRVEVYEGNEGPRTSAGLYKGMLSWSIIPLYKPTRILRPSLHQNNNSVDTHQLKDHKPRPALPR